jgi:CspA family cold shock protein
MTLGFSVASRLVIGQPKDVWRVTAALPRVDDSSERDVTNLLPRPADVEWDMPQQGVVKFFNSDKGYGFIKPDDGGNDIFVHGTAVSRAGLQTLDQGQKVSFEVEPDKKGKGPKAVEIVVVADA